MFSLARSNHEVISAARLFGRQLQSRTDEIFHSLKMKCWDRNLMICKTCIERDLVGISFLDIVNHFKVWCFESGLIINVVRAFPSWSALCHALKR